jgi:hypothetical protein
MTLARLLPVLFVFGIVPFPLYVWAVLALML